MSVRDRSNQPREIERAEARENKGPEFVLFEGYATRDFADGFDCGRIWYRLRTEEGPFTETLHFGLRLRLTKIAIRAGWLVSFKQDKPICMEATFTRDRRPPEEIDPSRKHAGM